MSELWEKAFQQVEGQGEGRRQESAWGLQGRQGPEAGGWVAGARLH